METQPPSADHIQSIQARDKFARELFARIDAGESPDLDQLRGVSGVRFEPTSWEELCSVIEDGSPEALARLGRSPMALKHYWDDLHRIKTELFVSMTDNLYARIFKLPTEAAEDGRERAIVPAEFHDKETIVWKANDYPYW
ncbi:hypothetical protein QBZ16_003511 [Prototheca wickerhamii]|uniref:Uncharacterized protein n=1 Tax=Prototheca wickerhamii TaxID=3111 RepID=A0AAD9IJ47_PROWI|nr:hypothetical protein QBZ16_003511 [Prototheca wickerhamii]